MNYAIDATVLRTTECETLGAEARTQVRMDEDQTVNRDRQS